MVLSSKLALRLSGELLLLHLCTDILPGAGLLSGIR